jgi:hypothetical protein
VKSPLIKLLLKAGWAPIAVMLLHAAVASTRWRVPLDFTIHFLGGISIAFFSFHAIDCFKKFLGETTTLLSYVLSFTAACTVGVFWELGEFASDVYLGTHIQQSIRETMSDLIADVSGATLSLLLIFLVGRLFLGTK